MQSVGTIISGAGLFLLLNQGFHLRVAFYIGIMTLIPFMLINLLFDDNKGSPKESLLQIIRSLTSIIRNYLSKIEGILHYFNNEPKVLGAASALITKTIEQVKPPPDIEQLNRYLIQDFPMRTQF